MKATGFFVQMFSPAFKLLSTAVSAYKHDADAAWMYSGSILTTILFLSIRTMSNMCLSFPTHLKFAFV
jgi:hypothetical protein